MKHKGLACLALAIILSGCTGTPADVESQAPTPSWKADCSFPDIQHLDDGECIQLFSASGDHQQSEVSLATHPSDPKQVAFAWTDIDWSPTPKVTNAYVAVTRDGGASWRAQRITDPSTAAPGTESEAFDPTIRYGPDGTIFLSYGNNNPGTAAIGSAITLARSIDGGETWTYHRVTAGYWDYMDIAVAPDTGTLYAQAQLAAVAVPVQIFLWRSMDKGDTWEGPFPMTFPGNPGASFTGRLAAAANNTVFIHVGNPQGGTRLFRSIDGGQTWDPPTVTPDSGTVPYSVPQSSPLVSADGQNVTLVQGQGKQILEINLVDRGRALVGVEQIGDDMTWHVHWAVGAQGPPNSIGVLAEAHDVCDGGTAWEVAAILPLPRAKQSQTNDAAPSFQTLRLASAQKAPIGCRATNEYGGFAFAADGSAWAAWSDPRGSENPRIAVARLVSREP